MKCDFKQLEAEVIALLRQMYDPEIPLNIYDMGLIYRIAFETVEAKVVCHIDMTLTSPGCPVADMLFDQVRSVGAIIDGIDEVELQLVFDPPWDPDNISFEGKLEMGIL